MSADASEGDPTLFCTAFKKKRFYYFSRREPDESGTSGAGPDEHDGAVGRDVFNEKPTADELVLAAEQVCVLSCHRHRHRHRNGRGHGHGHRHVM